MEACHPCANVVDIRGSTINVQCLNDLQFLTRELMNGLSTNIDQVINCLMESGVDIGLAITKESWHKDEDVTHELEDEKKATLEEVENMKSEKAEKLYEVCFVESKRADDQVISQSLIKVLLDLHMDYAADCVKRIKQAWHEAG